jgi:hypothetical protein
LAQHTDATGRKRHEGDGLLTRCWVVSSKPSVKAASNKVTHLGFDIVLRVDRYDQGCCGIGRGVTEDDLGANPADDGGWPGLFLLSCKVPKAGCISCALMIHDASRYLCM